MYEVRACCGVTADQPHRTTCHRYDPAPAEGVLDADQFADAIKAMAAHNDPLPPEDPLEAEVEDALAGWSHLTDGEFDRAAKVRAAVVDELKWWAGVDQAKAEELAGKILDAIVQAMTE